jgi:broad specificity phosphatase PhoE
MKLFFTRHGESEANVLGVFSNTVKSKYGLSEKGRHQTEELGQKLQHVGFDRMLCSPVKRTKETAEILTKYLHIQPEFTNAIQEYCCGIYEEKSKKDHLHTVLAVEARWFHEKDFDAHVEGGESFNDIKKRFMPFITEIIEKYKHTSENILFIAHSGFYKAALPMVFSNITLEYSFMHELRHCQLAIGEYRNGKVICTEWAGERMVISE